MYLLPDKRKCLNYFCIRGEAGSLQIFCNAEYICDQSELCNGPIAVQIKNSAYENDKSNVKFPPRLYLIRIDRNSRLPMSGGWAGKSGIANAAV